MIFHKHDWHYALGTSEGILSGNARELCLKRYCPKCEQHQHIERYTSAIRGVDGVAYLGNPIWVKGK